jgi:hypothetical protein
LLLSLDRDVSVGRPTTPIPARTTRERGHFFSTQADTHGGPTPPATSWAERSGRTAGSPGGRGLGFGAGNPEDLAVSALATRVSDLGRDRTQLDVLDAGNGAGRDTP